MIGTDDDDDDSDDDMISGVLMWMVYLLAYYSSSNLVIKIHTQTSGQVDHYQDHYYLLSYFKSDDVLFY